MFLFNCSFNTILQNLSYCILEVLYYPTRLWAGGRDCGLRLEMHYRRLPFCWASANGFAGIWQTGLPVLLENSVLWNLVDFLWISCFLQSCLRNTSQNALKIHFKAPSLRFYPFKVKLHYRGLKTLYAPLKSILWLLGFWGGKFNFRSWEIRFGERLLWENCGVAGDSFYHNIDTPGG